MSARPAPQRQHNEDRIRRSLAWLERSRQESTEDMDRFVFLWIAFNAAYGNEAALRDFVERDVEDERGSESYRFRTFLRNIVEKDADGNLERIVWEEFSGPIRILLGNPYVFRPFWRSVWNPERDGDWRRSFEDSKKVAGSALARRDIFTVLSVVFDRLYTLRNQIFHGGATWPGGFGKDQIRDGSRIMASLVPAILDIMQRDIDHNPDSDLWGKVAYPRSNPAPE